MQSTTVLDYDIDFLAATFSDLIFNSAFCSGDAEGGGVMRAGGGVICGLRQAGPLLVRSVSIMNTLN